MSLSNLEIFKTILLKKIEKNDSFVVSETKTKSFGEFSGMSCFNYWCYKITIEKLPLSELKPQKEKDKMKEYHIKMEEEILTDGFDYNKGYITITSSNIISDGHHRYQILKKNFGSEHEVFVRKIWNISRPSLHFVFINLIMKPIKSITQLFI